MRMLSVALLTWVLALVVPVYATTCDTFERLLFPIVVTDYPGAFDTVWSSEFSVRNESTSQVEMFTSECLFRCDQSRCFVSQCEPGKPTPPHSQFAEEVLLTRGEGGPVENPGTLLYVERCQSSEIATSLRLRDQTGTGNTFGVEIPVVREQQLASTTLWLPDVPLRSDGRTHLRIYGVESPSGDATVRVRVFAVEGETPLLDRSVSLKGLGLTDKTPRPGAYDEFQPSYAFLDLSTALRDEGRVRVQVDSLTSGLKFWAMASITSNVTQQITIISPQ
jgi:hypothetical protein